MIRISLLLLVGLVGALGQLSEYDSPLPPRPVVPGAVALGGGGGGGRRPSLRVPGGRRVENFGGGAKAPSRRLPPLEEAGPIPRRLSPLEAAAPYPRRLPPSEGLAPRRLPNPPPLPPRPVIEEDDDDSLEATTLPLPPPPFRPAIFRPPIDEDFPPQQTTPQFLDEIPLSVTRGTPRPLPVLQEAPVQRVRPEAPSRTRPPVQDQPRFRPIPAEPPQRPQPQRTRPVPQEQDRPAPPRQLNRQQVVQRPDKEYNKGSDPSLSTRARKPASHYAQVLRKYREDNPDGSITWGFENDDGTFKEETIGVDCVTRGKYGYIDPDGVRREFTYSSGLPCDKDRDAQLGGTDQGYIDYTNNKYVMPNGDAIELNNMVKNRARKPIGYRN